ncbi:hypothetical protein LTR10_019055 [Elasticomyces elasticus]|uniref:Uncharacterized protein n=1 Tax=Exophiala sideris TaxID=1016849 RepID=A0ABR0IYW8_9EURO|nr:hypothetical protein LTR10_019055 [Elasticomyces elasticus]KAK5022941.1 hypothetical protein LTS07_009669 [Exophiala sideris]KAK5026380.1 hypothetical protein LTR13_009994 [Exophiala sideris]KAK5052314.1 hypothetical protein LTR69_009850 [Exophiala sideris]KAK5177342.1 hypothetical protein LTR44_010137 [Eurotiomycetes sp. CCFEE 6388]
MSFPDTQWPDLHDLGVSRPENDYSHRRSSTTSVDVNSLSKTSSGSENHVRGYRPAYLASRDSSRERVEDVHISLNGAMTGMTEDNPGRPDTPSSLLSFTPDVFLLQSLDHSDEPTLLETLDKPIRFLRDFRIINALRQQIQNLRVRARDERARMRLTRQRMLQASSELARIIQTQQDAIQKLQSFQHLVEQLDSEELSCDAVESDLIPAEWKLKEAEQLLYEDILGAAAVEQSEIDPNPWVAHATLADIPLTNDAMDHLARLAEFTPEERALALDSEDRDLRVDLGNLERSHEPLVQDTKMRAAAGVPVDPITQDLIKDYVDRRGNLLQQLAFVAEAKSTLAAGPTSDSDLAAVTDALFQCDQFGQVDTDASIGNVPTNNDETLHLSTDDIHPRRDDIVPLLAQPMMEASEAVEAVQTFATYSEIEDFGNVGMGANDLATYVSKWILACARSSWWSLARFVFEWYLDDSLSYKTMEEYLPQTFSVEKDVLVSHAQAALDMESLPTSKLPDDSFTGKAGEGQVQMQSTHISRGRAHTQ